MMVLHSSASFPVREEGLKDGYCQSNDGVWDPAGAVSAVTLELPRAIRFGESGRGLESKDLRFDGTVGWSSGSEVELLGTIGKAKTRTNSSSYIFSNDAALDVSTDLTDIGSLG
ncbi:hypothetical protein FRC08_014080 [Ceratobasidium sp. 394]|nr:hypothetical protein FRC08_014080 [Ceratobasidium sp. 394]